MSRRSEHIVRTLGLAVFLCMVSGSAWAAMSVATLNGTYKSVDKVKVFEDFGGGLINDFISTSNITLTFDGNGSCTFDYSGEEYEVTFGNPANVRSSSDGESGSCSYSVLTDGETQINFPDGSGTFSLSADGNVLLGGDASAEDGWYQTGTMMAVKAGSGLTNASLNGTYKAVSSDSVFEDFGGGVLDFISTNKITLTFDGSGGCAFNVAGEEYEVTFGNPDNVRSNLYSEADSCNYTVSPDGETQIIFPDGSGTFSLSADGNVLLGGDASAEDGWYQTGTMMAVKAGSGLTNASLNGTYKAVSSDSVFEDFGSGILDFISTNNITLTFDGSGDCAFNVAGEEYEVTFGNPDNVRSYLYAEADNCTYTVFPDGETQITVPDGSETFSLSADGNVLLGGAASAVDGWYQTGTMIAIKVNIPTPLNDTTEFVKQLYRDFLNREGDEGGIAYWVDRIDGQTATRAAAVESYLLSQEFGEQISPVVRLYFAYFLRIPDYDGLMYWVGRHSQGTTLEEISNVFAGSAEFQQTYGNLSNQQFVELIYENVLGREPDAGGLAFWTSELDTGNRSRGQVMVGFSEAAEYKQLKDNPVYVTMVYMGLLRRAPDPGGFDYWVNRMDGGDSGQILIDGFLDSAEYAARF